MNTLVNGFHDLSIKHLRAAFTKYGFWNTAIVFVNSSPCMILFVHVVDTAAGKGFDFLLGSVHFVDGFAFDHKPEHWSHVDVDTVYRRFFETSIDLANSGIYDGIAHPDSIKLFGHLPSFSLQPYYEELACSLSRQNMYAEQSSGIYRRCPGTAELGMTHDLLVCMKRHHVPIITVSDAHCPKDVGAKIPELAALLE